MDILRPLNVNEVASEPAAPTAGNVVFYALNGVIYAKNSDGLITQMGLTPESDPNFFGKIWAANTLMNC